MSGFDKRDVTIDRAAKRSPSTRIADLGDRLARSFSVTDRQPAGPGVNGAAEHPLDGERAPAWDQVLPRFPITRQGYDCNAVDEHVAELEQELLELDREVAELRASTPTKSETAAEIERIGEQTSAILLAAHETAQETTRLAQAQADRCIADAASNAIAMTTEANQQLSELHHEMTSLYRERARLLEDVRGVADALSSLADDAPRDLVPEPVSASAGPESESEPATLDESEREDQ